MRNIKSYIKKATLVFQEEGKEDITIEIEKGEKVYKAYAPEINGSKVCCATTVVEVAKMAFESAVAMKEGKVRMDERVGSNEI